MQSIISSEIFIITLVAGVYLAALWVYRKTRLALLHPLLVSIPALVAVMSVIGIPYESFRQGSRMINFLLGPSVVALGYVLWEQVEYMKSNAVSIMTSIFVGSLVGIVSVICIARWMGLSLGAAAHGLGTARAMELGALEGAISGLAIGLMGVMTAILVPIVEWVMSLF